MIGFLFKIEGFLGTHKTHIYLLDNCENLPSANVVSYDSSNINIEMIDAAKHNKTAILKCLIKNGADINSVDSDGISALMYAVATGNVPNVNFLIENGADVNAANQEGQTVLIFASGKGHKGHPIIWAGKFLR